MTKSSCSGWCCLTLTLFLFQGLWFPIRCAPQVPKNTTEFEDESSDALPESRRKRSSPRCPDGWDEFGTKCYRVFGRKFSERKTWTAANAKCIETGSTLVSIHSREEQRFLASYVPSIGSGMWIGLHRQTPSERLFTFRWTDNSPTDFEDWTPNEPNFYNGQEECVHLSSWANPIGKWNDMECSRYFPFICQKPKVICGEDIEYGEGSISSPNYPEKYSANAKCIWRITVPSGYLVHLTFRAFKLEQQRECNYDYVKIFDGRDLSRPPLKILCGSDIPSDIFSPGNELSIEFKSDSTSQYDGFSIQFRKDYQCGGDIVAEEGAISSLNYPNTYLPNARCSWKITVPANYRISFKFLSFKLQKQSSCIYDYVKIFDGHESGSPILGKFCGYDIPDVPVSSGNRMRIDFQSDSSIQYKGFTAEFKKGDCGADIVSHEGAIATPGYPAHYKPSMSCVWRITVQTGYDVVLTFVDMKLEGPVPCIYFDYVMVLDGHESSSPILGTFCGYDIPNAIRSSGNKLSIKFKSDNSKQYEGFSAQFKKGQCLKNIVAEEGVIFSPNYPNNYDPSIKCIWKVTVPAGYRIVLTFQDFQVESGISCNNDYVKVLDGHESNNPTLGTFCGHDIPPVTRSSGNKLSIEFMSDTFHQYKGFYAKFEKESMCADDTCKNGGSCSLDGVNGGFKCTCEHGYRGITCDEKISCDPDTCLNGGSCTQDGPNGIFRCTCTLRYRGLTCDEIRQVSAVNYISIGVAVLVAVQLTVVTVVTVFILIKRSRKRRSNNVEFVFHCGQEGSV